MGFEKIWVPITPEGKKQENKPWLLRYIFRPKEATRRAESLTWDKEKQDAEKLLKDFPDARKAAREVTEKWAVIDQQKVALLLQQVPPEKKAIIDAAKSYLGTKESNSPKKIEEFHKSAGKNGCGCDTAWCMSFVQDVLKETHNPNYKATAWAKDGLGLWKPTNNPQIGDLLIVERWDGWHIGFFLWFSDSGNPIILGWNQGDGEVSVKEETRPVLWYRNIA